MHLRAVSSKTTSLISFFLARFFDAMILCELVSTAKFELDILAEANYARPKVRRGSQAVSEEVRRQRR